MRGVFSCKHGGNSHAYPACACPCRRSAALLSTAKSGAAPSALISASPRYAARVAASLRCVADSAAALFFSNAQSPYRSPVQAGKCDVTCNAPVCAWKCRKPDLCPRPQCRMVCDSAPGCAGSAGPVPVPRQSELAALSSQRAPPPLIAVVQQAQTPNTPAAVPTLASGSSAQPVTVPTLASTN